MKKAVVAVVLAAGQGTRMKSDLPKVLHEVAGIPLAAHAVQALRKAGVKRVVVVVGYEKEKVRAALAPYGVEFAHQKQPLGTGHAVLAARPLLGKFDGDVLVIGGDTPLVRPETFRALLSRHREAGAFATIGTFGAPLPNAYGRIVRAPGGAVQGIVEAADASDADRRITEVNSGLYAFSSPELFARLARVKPSPKKGEYYLTDVIAQAAWEGKRIETSQSPDPVEFLGINTMKELAEAERVLRFRLMDAWMAEGVRIVDPANTYIDSGVEIGAGSVIHPYTVIRTGARIGRNCHVGPFATLRGKTVLADGAEVGNFVEVKNGRLGKKTKAKHLAYLGDVAIGNASNIGAGTIVANYDGKAKWPTTIGDGAFIGSGAILVAPVKIGKKALVGAGAVVRRNQNVPPGMLAVGVPARIIGKNPLAAGKTGKP